MDRGCSTKVTGGSSLEHGGPRSMNTQVSGRFCSSSVAPDQLPSRDEEDHNSPGSSFQSDHDRTRQA